MVIKYDHGLKKMGSDVDKDRPRHICMVLGLSSARAPAYRHKAMSSPILEGSVPTGLSYISSPDELKAPSTDPKFGIPNLRGRKDLLFNLNLINRRRLTDITRLEFYPFDLQWKPQIWKAQSVSKRFLLSLMAGSPWTKPWLKVRIFDK